MLLISTIFRIFFILTTAPLINKFPCSSIYYHLSLSAGLSERALVDYCISLAKRTPDASRLATSLESQGLPASPETRRFAQDLLSRLRPSSSGGGGGVTAKAASSSLSYKQQERAAADLARKNESYGLLLDADDDGDGGEAAKKKSASSKSSKSGEKSKHHRRSRKEEDDDQTTIDNNNNSKTTAVVVTRPSRKRAWEEETEVETEERRAAEELQRDLDEKAEFEQRLRERDEAKTRKLAERKVPREEIEEMERRRKAEDAADRSKMVSDLRKYSRQEYLKKREEAKIEDLEAEIEEEERLFSGVPLSAKEAADLTYKREVLRLAREKKRHLDELERDEGYHMPDAYDGDGGKSSHKRYEVLTQRYREADDEAAAAADAPWAKQEAFEAEQIRKATMNVGVKHKQGKGEDAAAAAAEYDFVFEDQIEFIVDTYLAGDRPVSYIYYCILFITRS